MEIFTEPANNGPHIHSTSQCCNSLKDQFSASGGGGKNKTSKAGYGVRADVDVAEMEKAQPLGEHRLAIDAVSGYIPEHKSNVKCVM